MDVAAAIGFGLLAVFAIGWSIYDFCSNVRAVITPDTVDQEAIEARFGKDTPEARAALRKRFGPGDHWRDAATGLSGLAGLAFLYWIWFG